MPTKPGNGVTTPTPTEPGITDNCNKFCFVSAGQGCQQVADANKITLANFIKWNPEVGSDCSGMWAKTYHCVGVL